MAGLDVQKQLEDAAAERSGIAKTLLSIQQTLDQMAPSVAKMEPALVALEPVVQDLAAWRPGVDTAVGKLQTDTGDILAHLAKIATRSFPTGSSSTMLPTTCSTGFPSRDASASVSALTSPAAPSSFTSTNDVVSELAAPVVSDEALVVEASVVAALTPTRCSTGGLDHKTDKDDSKALCLLPWSVPTLFTIPQEASPPQSFQLFVAIELDIKAPTRCSTMCFTEDTTVCTYLFMADVTQSSRRQRQMLRPIPWPSFTCHSRVGHPMKPCSATQALRWALQLAASSHIPVTLGSMQDNFHLPLPFCLQFVQQINADFEAPLCWERHRGIFQHGVAPSLPRTDLLQENLNENPKYSIRITSCESGYKLLHTSLLLWIRAVCVFLCCSVQFQWKVAWLVYHLSNRCPVALVRLPMPANYFTSIWIYAVHKEVLIIRLYCCSTTKSEGMQANLATSWTEIKPRSHFCIVPISGLNQEFHLESLCNPGASWYGMCTNFQAEKIQNWMVSVIELSSVYLKRPLLIHGSDASIMLEGLPGPNLHMSLKILNAAHGGISLIYFMGDIKYNYEKLSGAPLYCSEQLQWEIAWQSFVPVITSRKCISYIETITRSFYTTWAPLQFLQFVSILVHVSDWFGSLQLQKLWNPSYTWSESTWRLHQLRRLLGHMNTWLVCIYGQQSYARPVGRPRPIQDLQIKQGVGGSIYHLVSHKYDCLVHKEKTRTKNQVSLLELSELTLFTSVGNAEVQGTMLFTDTSVYWQFLRKEEFEGSGIYSSDDMTVPQSVKGILGSELIGSYQVSQFRRTVLVGLQWSTYCLFSGTRSLWQQENAQPCHMILFGSIANSRSCASFPGSKYTVADNLTAHPVGELVSLKLIQVGFVTLLGSDSSSGRHLEQLWDPGGNTSSFCPPPSSEEIASYQGIWMGGWHSVDAIELPSSCEPDPFQGERRIMVSAFVAHHYCLNAFLDKIHFVHAYFQVQVCTGHDNLKDYLDFDQVLFNKDYYLNDATVFDLDRFYLDTFLGQVCIDHDFYLVEVSLDYSYHRNYDQAKHQVQWDPGGSRWSRLGVKPNFKEGGMSRELLPLVHQEKPKACPQGPSGE